MSDNIQITVGAGPASIASEDVSSVYYHRWKVVDGTDLSVLPWVVNAQGAALMTDNNSADSVSFGVSGAVFTSADQSAAAASVTDAPTSGQKLVITDVLIAVAVPMRVDLKEETSGTVIASIYLSTNEDFHWIPRGKTKLATADKKLQVQTDRSGNLRVTANYYSEA